MANAVMWLPTDLRCAGHFLSGPYQCLKASRSKLSPERALDDLRKLQQHESTSDPPVDPLPTFPVYLTCKRGSLPPST